jgi:hypothetical protein
VVPSAGCAIGAGCCEWLHALCVERDFRGLRVETSDVPRAQDFALPDSLLSLSRCCLLVEKLEVQRLREFFLLLCDSE